MSHGIHTTMDRIESAAGYTRPNHLFGQPDGVELPPSHNPMLATGQGCDSPVKNLRV